MVYRKGIQFAVRLKKMSNGILFLLGGMVGGAETVIIISSLSIWQGS